MPFLIPGQTLQFEGNHPASLFPARTTDDYRQRDLMRRLKKYLEAGGKVYIEFMNGARKGSMGRLDIEAHECDDLYKMISTGRGDVLEMQKKIWHIVFDDRKSTVKVEYAGLHNNWQGVLRFDATGTTWVYTTVARENKVLPVFKDHFGTVIEMGSLVMFLFGRKGEISTRFGYVKAINESGTLKVETIKTRPNHTKITVSTSPTVSTTDVVVLDGDIRDKITLAKLTHG